ncbi:protein psiI-like [Rana temporaria]|uniref:protein psiI-like n=1 Tax=Rana temporaria TaxID=8407 RepID=UPI001AAC8E9B|nr:protein psiI-like [Rana temporaria]
MGIKNHPITLQGCLLIWIGISLVLVKDTTEVDSTTEDPTTESVSATPMNAAAEITAPTMGDMKSPLPTSNSSLAPDDFHNTCHLYYCMGDSCYKNESSFSNAGNTTCPTYCEMYRHNSSFYESRCNQHCMHHLCNSTQQDGCALNCCNRSMCFSAEDMNGGNMTAKPPVTSTTTTTVTTTTTTILYSDKKCRSFTCSETDCFKNQASATLKQCQVGINHCELQKKVTNGAISYEGGCSNTCATSTKSCATITSGDCFQECCNSTTTGCCMKLDGQVHFNAATQIHNGSVLRMFICAFIVIFLSHYFSSSHV